LRGAFQSRKSANHKTLALAYPFLNWNKSSMSTFAGTSYLLAMHPIGTFGRPEEVAAAGSLPLFTGCGMSTGVAGPLDGGFSA
jgi:hypothetical protein